MSQDNSSVFKRHMGKLGALAIAGMALAGIAAPAFSQGLLDNFEPVTDEVLQNPADGDWLMWRRTLNSWNYSPVDQLTPDNADQLQLAWARGMAPGYVESTPLIYNGIMYLAHANDVIQALDATTGDVLWEYRRVLPEGIGALASTTRNVAIWEDKIIVAATDATMLALDATTGQVVWETPVGNEMGDVSHSSGPIIANGKAISGRSCMTRDSCFIAAHDLESGEELWRFYTMPLPGEPGSETWGDAPEESRRHIGSWLPPSFDPELNLVYAGTSVTNPYAKVLIGDPDLEYLYQTSTLALDADTGELVWYQQHLVDHWDLDHPFERILVDTAIAPNADEVRWISPDVVPGEERRVLTGIPGKTGIFYSIDRETGEFLWARETVMQNVIADIDLETGKAILNPDTIPMEVGQELFTCPSAFGGKNWQGGTYSPDTNAIYYSLHNTCAENLLTEADITINPRSIAPGEEFLGSIRAFSVETGEQLWRFDNQAATMGLVSTAGGVVFGGDMNHRFRAFDAETGEVLWETILAGPIGGYPVSYEVDGRQYVAVAVGEFLTSGTLQAMTPELRPGMAANSIFVFALPE